MRKTNTNLSNYDDFRKYSVEEIGNNATTFTVHLVF